ncbi:MAG TPA: glycoside hydrolase family 3 N-terminal domain-containing protein [Methylomirabilota bacterium]|nr:glycoside hydrolase family 3 N-terminal domain-containing protein [Methylomirabilota bacterium]
MKRHIGIVLVVSLLFGCGSRTATPAGGVGPARAVLTAQTIEPIGVADSAAAAPTLGQLIGQKLVVRMDGATPSADLLGRIRRGEVGGIILFGPNVTTPTALIALTAQLRAAAASGGQPRLLIAVDQEGGPIKRIPWAPPTLSAPQMGRLGSASVARAQGASTAAALRGLGIDVDLAPVADVPASTASFMYRAGRTFSFSATRTALLTDAFASGLESKGVVPAMKHFPGIGFATRNTDAYVVTIRASRAALAPGLLPYRMAIRHAIPLIMLSNATYPAYDARNAAGWSHAIGVTLLRHDLGFTGVTITDSLDGTAKARGLWTRVLAVSAARAGTDMILTTGSEASTRGVYATLLRQAELGSIPLATLRASYDRILALKAGL